jgi:hypothetical protein
VKSTYIHQNDIERYQDRLLLPFKESMSLLFPVSEGTSS